MTDSHSSQNTEDGWELVACPETGTAPGGAPGYTLRERRSGQLMHSRIGPWTEANAVYVGQSGPIFEPGRRDSPNAPKTVVLYDVGMGLATNALAAIAAWRGPGTLRIFSFERYPEALATALDRPESFAFHAPYRAALRELLEKGEWSGPAIEWKLLVGDFREVSLAALPPADLIYFDFYAPSACLELWSAQVFSKLRAKTAEEGKLITYASSKAVRVSLLLSGFFVGEGAATTLKSTTTLASLSKETLHAPLGTDWLESLERASGHLPEGWRKLALNPQFFCFASHPTEVG